MIRLGIRSCAMPSSETFGTYDNPSSITFAKLKHALTCNIALATYFCKAKEDMTLSRGGGPDGKSKIFIPKGMLIDYSVHVLHHRQDLWSPNAEDFISERWEVRKLGWEFLTVYTTIMSCNHCNTISSPSLFSIRFHTLLPPCPCQFPPSKDPTFHLSGSLFEFVPLMQCHT